MNEVVTIENSTGRQFDLSPQTFEQALTFSKYLADSDLVPKDFKGKPANCLIAMQWGMELGLKPLQALQNLAVINGRPAIWGDAVIAIVRGSPLCEYVSESDDGNTATCRVKRRGKPEQVRTFSMDDAKTAGLSGKTGPWTQYPKRMRQMRARAFALRDVFPDVLRGMPVAEELMDTPAGERFMGPADVVPTQAITNQTTAAPYTPEEFEKQLPKWRALVEAGTKTPQMILDFIETKRQLTPEQRTAIEALDKPAVPAAETHEDAPVLSYAEVADGLHKAQDMDALALAGSQIGLVRDAGHRAELAAIYDNRAEQLQA